MLEYINNEFNAISKETKEATMIYNDIMRQAISDTFEYNIFWIFWRDSSWMRAPMDIRVVDVYMVIELKKMLEYFALATMLSTNREAYYATLQKTYNNLNYTWLQKLEKSMGKIEAEKRFSKILPNKSIDWDQKYEKCELSQMIRTYIPEYTEIYKKLNYIQHNSLIPSAQARAIQNELFKCSKGIIERMHHIFKKTYSMDEEDAIKLEKAYTKLVKYL
ncbi:MAG: hypothetical protein HRT98_03265 [Mycoplasmatales bacterium]|nr:hypothetical protein [Mycoplasmatales bacterium]